MSSMFSGYSEGLLSISDLQIHFDSKLRLTSVNVGSFCLGIFSPVSLDEAFCLIDENGLSSLWLAALTCNSES